MKRIGLDKNLMQGWQGAEVLILGLSLVWLFSGVQGQGVLCSPACQNGGLCLQQNGATQCNCAGTGYTGTSCQNLAGAPANSSASISANSNCPVACQNGDCTQQFNSNQYYCKCKSGFSGSSCDSQSAASAPTSFNTSSVNQNCPVACVSGKCTQQFNSNQYYCQCNSGFTGSACDSASAPANATQSPSTNQACPVSCANGTCTRQFNSDQYYCKCKDGYSGANCNQLSASTPSSAPSSNQNCPVSCLNGLCTQQFNSNQYYCQCTSGWSGSSCGTLANATSPTTSASNQSCPVSCDNGRCTKQFNSDQYYCQCNSGYSGSACTTASGSAPVSSSSGTNNQSCPVACYNGDCTRQFNSDAYYCKCRSGYTGASCNANGPSTSPPGLVVAAPGCGSCLHGSCVQSSNGTAHCQCSTGYQGSSCNQQTVSAATSRSTGANNGGKNLSGGAIFGIVVGVMVGLLAIGAAGFLIWRRRRTRTFIKFQDSAEFSESKIEIGRSGLSSN